MNMKRLFLQFLFIGIGLSLNAQIKECGKLISGKVLCDNKGVVNVMVTDGKDCTLTNSKGEYTLCSDGQARFVYLSVPSGYLVKSENTIPKFYQKIDPHNENPYDFYLIKNPKNDLKHCFLVQADVQVTSEEDLHAQDIFKDETLKLSGGWDCAPVVRDRNMGIYQKVTLESTGDVILENPFIVTTLPQKDTTVADVNIKLELKNTSDIEFSGVVNAQITLVNEVKFPSYIKHMVPVSRS